MAIGLDVMDEYPGTHGHSRRYISERHCGRIRDFSLGDRENRQILVKTLRRRFPEEVHQTNIVLIDCRAFRDPASSALRNHWGVHPTTLSKILNHHKFLGLLLDLVERVIRLSDKKSPNKDTVWFHLLESSSSFSRMQLSHAGQTHCTHLHSEYAHDSNCFEWTTFV